MRLCSGGHGGCWLLKLVAMAVLASLLTRLVVCSPLDGYDSIAAAAAAERRLVRQAPQLVNCFTASRECGVGDDGMGTAEECCLGEGMSFRFLDDPQTCHQCVVFGWLDFPEFRATEISEPFQLQVGVVKGEFPTSRRSPVVFRIIDTPDTADSSDYFLQTGTIRLEDDRAMDVPVTFRVDSVALETEERAVLSLLFEGDDMLAANEFVRENITLVIEDGDSAIVQFTEVDYRINENDGVIQVVIQRLGASLAFPLALRVTPINISEAVALDARGELRREFTLRPFPIGADIPEIIPPANATIEATSYKDFNASVIDVVFEPSALLMEDRPVLISVTDDDINEAQESFVVLLEVVTETERVNVMRSASLCLVQNDDPIRIGYEKPSYTFGEVGRLIEEVMLVKEDGIISEQDFIVVVQPGSTTVILPDNVSPALLFEDYQFNIGVTVPIIPFPANRQNMTVLFVLLRDARLEGTEGFALGSSPNRGFLPFSEGRYPATLIVINDSGIVVGFLNTSTTVSEDVGSFEICVGIFPSEIEGLRTDIDIPFNLTVHTVAGEAGAADYEEILAEDIVLVEFNADNSTHEQCFSVSVRDDVLLEGTESFSLTLSLQEDCCAGMPVSVTPNASVVWIQDNDFLVLGFEETELTVAENQGSVTLDVSVFEGMSAEPVTVLLTTVDDTATAPEDFTAIDGLELIFFPNTTTQQVTIALIADSQAEPAELFQAVLREPLGLTAVIVDPPIANITVLDSEGEIFVNDTLIADPLFTVPLQILDRESLGFDQTISLCYEIHGADDIYLNMISDICTSVNAHYSSVSEEFNLVDEIAIRAIDAENNCREILVTLDDQCLPIIDGDFVIESDFTDRGISIRTYPNRVRISVPNCAHTQLVMWVVCQNATLTTYSATPPEVIDVAMVKFVVTRGFNLQERSHGIIGQFWNIPVVAEPFNGTLRSGEPAEDYFIISVDHPDSELRRFPAFFYDRSWDIAINPYQPCLYAGTSQGGRGSDIEGFGDPVIEGVYRQYIVGGRFQTEYDFSRFDSADLCI